MKATPTPVKRSQFQASKPFIGPNSSPAFFSPAANRLIQRTGEDEAHELTSDRFSGDPVLEAVFDGERVLQPVARDPAVRRVQESLIELGFQLPTHGVDGVYGSETVQALQAFQERMGLPRARQDGILGHRTMSLLDQADREGFSIPDLDQEEHDFQVRGIHVDENFQVSDSAPMAVHFGLDSSLMSELTKSQLKQIQKRFPTQPLTLKGFASEEGQGAHNLRLADQRRDTVKEFFILLNHPAPALSTVPSEIGTGLIDYQKLRKVEIAPPGVSPSQAVQPTSRGRTTCSTQQSADLQAVLPAAASRGERMIRAAARILDNMSEKTQKFFDRVFRTEGATTARRAQVIRQVKEIMVTGRSGQDSMADHVGKMSQSTRHVCLNERHGACASGSPAFNRDTDDITLPNGQTVAGHGMTHLCPKFVQESEHKRAIILIHEGHHGTPVIHSDDVAYRRTRLIDRISTQGALENAGSFELFVEHAHNPDQATFGPEDDYAEDITEPEKNTIDFTIGLLQQWFLLSTFDLSKTFADARDARQQRRWKRDAGASRFVMDMLHRRFGLSHSSRIPTLRDQHRIAAIYHRFEQMDQFMEKRQTISKMQGPGGVAQWRRETPGNVNSLRVSDRFFQLPTNRRTTYLLQELVRGTPDISPNLEGEYVGLVNELRDMRSLSLAP